MESGYFFCADLLGFKSIIRNTEPDYLESKIDSWVNLVKNAAINNNIDRYQLLSDTIFVATDSQRNNLRNLINFSRELLNKGILQALPLRGAIAKGRYTWGKLVYGEAVIKAHELERIQNWIGVSIQDDIEFSEQDYYDMNLLCYLSPCIKEYPIKIYTVVAWDVPKIDDLNKLLASGGLTKKGDVLKWDWGNKLLNTSLFGYYLLKMKKNGLKPSQYHFTSFDFIDL